MKKLTNYIQLEDCVDNNLYIIDARNASIGIFRKETGGFLISRTKFTSNYIFEEYHWDIYKINPELEHYGTVKPLKCLGEQRVSYNSPDNELLIFLNDYYKEYRKEIEKELNNYISDYI